MKKVVKIKGLDCPNCAKTLENEINKLESVMNAQIDFLKSTLYFESDNVDDAFKEIVSLTKQIEPEAEYIVEKEIKSTNNNLLVDIGIIILGLSLGILSCFLDSSSAFYWFSFILSILLLGYKTYYKAFRLLLKGVINENLLLTISVIGATLLKENMEAFMVIGLYSIGKIFEGLAVDKSRKSIEKLTNFQPEFATILEGEKEKKVDPKEVKKGDLIIVRPGERVPVDGRVVSGSANLDMQSLTGESLPISVKENIDVISGSIVLDGVLRIVTTSEYNNSTISRIMNLIEHASEKKSKAETLISKITRWYTLGVIICSIVVFIIVSLVTRNIDTGIYRGLIFLVVSCPCAFAISVPLAYFSGIGNASSHGILIKGSNYLDACSKLNLVAFDKTGTLTTGKFDVESVKSFKEDIKEEDVIFYASIGEQYSLHPLAKSIVAYNKKELVMAHGVREVAGEGIYFTYNRNKFFVGRKSKGLSATVVELFINNEKCGEIKLKDTIKHSSKAAIDSLKEMKVETALLSGDNRETVEEISNYLNIDDSYSNLLPEDKFKWIEDTKKDKNIILGYVGDGINDSPSLMLADVGISMGINGSPSSIEASDIVLVDDNPSKVAIAIKISKYTQKIVWQNIILSAGIKISFLVLGTFGISGMLSAVFADVGVTLLAIVNSMRALAYKPNNKMKKEY